MRCRPDLRVLLALALCVAGVACRGRGGRRFVPGATPAPVTPDASLAPSVPSTHARSARSDRWLDMIYRLARDKLQSEGGAGRDGLPSPFTIDVPLGGGSGGGGPPVSLPLLVLPLPVAGRQECDASRGRDGGVGSGDDHDTRAPRPPTLLGIDFEKEFRKMYSPFQPQSGSSRAPPSVLSRAPPPLPPPKGVIGGDSEPREIFNPFRSPPGARDPESRVRARPPVTKVKEIIVHVPNRRGGSAPSADTLPPFAQSSANTLPPFAQPSADSLPAFAPNKPTGPKVKEITVRVPSRRGGSAPSADTLPPFAQSSADALPPFAPNKPAVTMTSKQLLEHFRAQAPVAPQLPPALIGSHPDYNSQSSQFDPRNSFPPGDDDRGSVPFGYLPPTGSRDSLPHGYLPPTETREPDPPRPRFKRSLLMRSELSVPRADFTEPYTAWWDASTGAARVDFHDDGTSTYRMPLPDGRVQMVEVRTDRTGERDVVRCGVSRPLAADANMRAPVALPDMGLFSFAGYATEGKVRMERWAHTATSAAGAARRGAGGEVLTYRHEMMFDRGADDFAKPVRYSVNVDSSVLGANIDGYQHRYMEANEKDHPASLLAFDLDRTCDERETLDPVADPEHAARLDPLREFMLPTRDPRHDAGMQRFVEKFERSYADEVEKAVRSNLLVQHSRFVSSCNRQDATFEVEVNFLADRLDVELELLLGVVFDASDAASDRGEAFPYSDPDSDVEKLQIPDKFDWRPEGAVSPVQYQDSCASCWAFAVAGSVEGALFVRSGRLVPLSQQCLVDCAHSHGAHGCKGTWPSHAYDYVKDRGLPALDEYTPYANKVLQCQDRRVPPVTHISGHVNVTPNSTNALKIAIRKEAPTVVVIDARPKSFIFYKKGVLRDDRCIKGPKKLLNHAVLAVGWGSRRGQPHFILKNTYSAGWGDGGYVRMHAPSNTCGVLTVPSYAVLRRPDIDPRGGAPSDRDDAYRRPGGAPRDRDDADRRRPGGASRPRDYPDISGPYY